MTLHCARALYICLLFGVLRSRSAVAHTDSAANIFCTARRCSFADMSLDNHQQQPGS